MPDESIIPVGLCQCGCGQKTKPAPYNSKRYRYVKGRPVYFIRGHHQTHRDILAWIEARLVPSGDCLVWTGRLNNKGYAQICYRHKMWLVNRLLYTLRHGPIPPKIDLCHSCDNPPCGLDAHHFLGTRKENVADMDAKGRRRQGVIPLEHHNRHVHPEVSQGESNRGAKLRNEQVLEIRVIGPKTRIEYRALAARFGVHWSTIQNIAKRKTWAHL